MANKRISTFQATDFKDEDFALDVKELKLQEVIGKGAFSTVHKGVYNSKTVAVKKQQIPDDELEGYIRKELGILRSVKTDKLVEFIGACKVNSKLVYIVTEYCIGGNLRRLVESGDPLGWRLRVSIAKGVAEGLMYMHDRDLIHRDIKTENVLLDNDLNPKLCDFGFSRNYVIGKNDKGRPMTLVGTDEFMAPEIIFGMDYNEKADIFSYGVVLAELISRKSPGKNGFLIREPRDGFEVNKENLQQVLSAESPPQSFYLLCEECLSHELLDRPSAEECFNWLDDLSNDLEPDTESKPIVNEEAILQQTSNPPSVSHFSDNSDTPSDFGSLSHIIDTTLSRIVSPTLQDAPGRGAGYKLAGYVVKRGGRIKTWKRRFMIMNDDGLHYYKHGDDFKSNPELSRQGSLLFSEMLIPPTSSTVCEKVTFLATGKKNSVRIMTKSRARYVCAPDDKQAERWVSNINLGYSLWCLKHENISKIVV